MRVLGVRIKENPLYVSYDDECWMTLAYEIMDSYTESYIHKFPMTAMSQAEYDKLNSQTYAPIRRSILRHIKHGPLKNAIDMRAVYSALERRRKENIRNLGIYWQDTYTENIEKL